MENNFPARLSALRRDRGLSQRRVAAELGISQALLSHYEKGLREPGLGFVCRVCDYYGVSADYLLCRSQLPDSGDLSAAKAIIDQMRGLLDRADGALNSCFGESI